MGPLPDGVRMPAAVAFLPEASVGRAEAGVGAIGRGWEEVGLVLRAMASGWEGREPSIGRMACGNSPQMDSEHVKEKQSCKRQLPAEPMTHLKGYIAACVAPVLFPGTRLQTS